MIAAFKVQPVLFQLSDRSPLTFVKIINPFLLQRPPFYFRHCPYHFPGSLSTLIDIIVIRLNEYSFRRTARDQSSVIRRTTVDHGGEREKHIRVPFLIRS
jgi:hypothetical protein